ncbi:hypothetical protein, partial [Rhodococcus zopfii]|uniref:hypothetical protein n=1 Tax=Rhodococcus zopfii TaxID=43772 RepID=UPI001C3F9FFB
LLRRVEGVAAGVGGLGWTRAVSISRRRCVCSSMRWNVTASSSLVKAVTIPAVREEPVDDVGGRDRPLSQTHEDQGSDIRSIDDETIGFSA